MKLLPPPHDNGNFTAILWAVLSQSIWLPVTFFNTQDQSTTNQRDYSSLLSSRLPQGLTGKLQLGSSSEQLSASKISPAAHASKGNRNTGILLNSIFSQSESSPSGPGRSLIDRHSVNALYGAPPPHPSNLSEAASGALLKQEISGPLVARGKRLSSAPFFQNLYSRSELLGGTLTLQDLSEPIMPPLARAERAQWSRSGDPLAPLPEIWREPMRRALNALAKDALTANVDRSSVPKESLSLNSARFVHIPSSRILQASEIPLALQADGSVDILNKPDDPVVIDEIRRWSAKQRLPEKGKISPAVVHLHPMEPLNSGPSHNVRPSSKGVSQVRSPDVPASSAPAPGPGPVSIPAITTDRPSPASVAPIGAAAPEPARAPEPVSSSKAES
jgi:hypothetical protein